jgi:hypothetical protein
MSIDSVNDRIAANEDDFRRWAYGAGVMGGGASPNKTLFHRLCVLELPRDITQVRIPLLPDVLLRSHVNE